MTIFCNRSALYTYIELDRTVCKTLEKIKNDLGDEFDIYFANGGDQDNNTIPEINICKMLNINLIEGLGSKVQSSSWLLNK